MVEELASELCNRGHNVIVCTTVVRKRLSISDKGLNVDRITDENGAKIIRVESSYQFSSNFIIRGLYQLIFPNLFWSNIKNDISENIDVIFTYSPPLSWGFIGNKIKKKTGAIHILNIQDIFPQNAIDLGILKNSLLIKYFEYQECLIYKSADKFTSHTKKSREFLIEKKGISNSSIEYVTNWIDVKTYENVSSGSYFKKKFELDNKFIFLFAGVIGPSQDLNFIIETAKNIRNDYPEICFLIVGDGIEKKTLMKKTNISKLDNVIFKSFVPIDQYPKLLKSSDVGIISLSSMNKTAVYPAKILGYMAASLPICSFLHKESDGHEIIDVANCGISLIHNVAQEEKNRAIIKMFTEKHKLKEYAKNGFEYVSNNFSKESCIDKLERMIIK